MKLSFCTLGCPDWTLEQIAQQAKAMGFDGVELRGAPGNHIGPEESPASRARIRRLFQDAGVAIACVMGYSNFTVDDAEQRELALRNMTNMIGVCQDIGCPTLRIFGGHNANIDRAEAVKRVVAAMQRLAPAAEQAGVTLAMETHDDWCVGENLMAVIRQVDSPRLGVCWDVSNASFVEPIDKTYAAVRSHIAHVHFKDAARGADGKVKSQLPGQGQVDMEQALRLLHQGGYQGWLSFEWEKKWEPELADPEVAFPHFLQHSRALMAKVGVPRG